MASKPDKPKPGSDEDYPSQPMPKNDGSNADNRVLGNWMDTDGDDCKIDE